MMEEAKETNESWYQVENVSEIPSPALLIHPDRIESNIRQMLKIRGNNSLLRPHVKTHKMPEVIKLQMNHGIYKFKSATIAEAEMAAMCGAKDILLAIQPAGPNLGRFFDLKQKFPAIKISCIADNEEIVIQLSEMSRARGLETNVWLDINNGMNRTGIAPGEKASRLFKRIFDSPMLIAEGLHVYDGHICEHDFSLRQRKCNDAFDPVLSMINDLEKEGITSINIIAGGSPTFPLHAMRPDVECSPGTLLLWDWGYSSSFADLNFLHSAVLLTRVISKPAKDLLSLDLGHKSVASEMPQPRVKFLGLENYTIINHNEEHMVIRTRESANYKIGDPLYCIPTHICPTVDRYEIAEVIKNNVATGQWNVEARKRRITI